LGSILYQIFKKRGVEMENLLGAEESRRIGQHEAIKANVENDVNAEIATRASVTTPNEAAKMNSMAENMRGKAINEVAVTEKEVDRARGLARVSQFIDYAFFVVYGLILLRFVLALMAARSNNAFVQFVSAISDPLYAPFKGIVASPSVEGGYTLALPMVIALVVYGLIHLTINGALRLFAERKTEI
jgi:uncharacterized protein YggT (Ycf19 family)